ncbi:M28 family metallopeptidase [Lentibacillus sp. N15]|uniref:M28 family metallopeptidase n=1 Tax=Lentibacillus songyuanensis TaxID=3136161 RepID=UPI0031BA38EA
MDKTSAFNHLKFFAECGTRIAGTEPTFKAAKYIQNVFQQVGLSTWNHEFDIPMYGLENSSYLKVKVNGKWHSLIHKSAWFSGNTPVDGIESPLVYAQDGSEAVLKRINPEGKVLLIARDSYYNYPDDDIYRRLIKYKPAAVLFTTASGWEGEPPDVYYNFNTVDAEGDAPPTAVILYSDALRLLEKDQDISVKYYARYNRSKGSCSNVIGTLQGTDAAAGDIVVCAHYDSVPGGPGIGDDAGGVVSMMALAEYYSKLARQGDKQRRTMHFIAWSGHEVGLHGSREFLRDNPDILNNTKFVFNYDIVGNRISTNTLMVSASHEITQEITNVSESLGYDWQIDAGVWGLDTTNFCAAQIPGVNLVQTLTNWNHTTRDNINSCHPDSFIDPLIFGKGLLNWVANTETIQQGYPEDMNEVALQYSKKYGWGLYQEVKS